MKVDSIVIFVKSLTITREEGESGKTVSIDIKSHAKWKVVIYQIASLDVDGKKFHTAKQAIYAESLSRT